MTTTMEMMQIRLLASSSSSAHFCGMFDYVIVNLFSCAFASHGCVVLKIQLRSLFFLGPEKVSSSLVCWISWDCSDSVVDDIRHDVHMIFLQRVDEGFVRLR